MMSISEKNMPGIGRRYDIVVAKGKRVALVIHHSGQRDLYIFDRHAEEPMCAVEFSDEQARRVGALLGGAFFKPAVVEEIEDIVGEFVVDWVTLPDDASAVGRSIADLQIRRRTGFSVVAIVRGRKTITAPHPDEVLRKGDRLVVVGRHADLQRFVDLVAG